MRLLHASPQGMYHRVYQTDPIETLNAMFENTEFTGFGVTPDIVGYGDIHSAYIRSWLLACYAVLDGADGNEPHPVSVTIVRVPYDIERAIADAAASDTPEPGAYAKELRTAIYRGSSD